MADIEVCDNCGEKFSVIEFPMGVPGGKEKESVICPHCRYVQRESMTDGWFSTSKINGN